MKKLAALVLLPPVVFVLPWILAAINRRWIGAAVLFVLWCAGLVITFKLWSGVGIGILLMLGLWSALTSVIEVTVTDPVV
jgi:hypothetical protein